jgi:signal transduction histidine kinase
MPIKRAAEKEFRKRFWWAISVPLVLLAILACLFAFQTSRLNASLQAMSRSNEILIHTARLRKAVVDTQSDAQQFLLSHDPNQRRAYEADQNKLPEIVHDLAIARGISDPDTDPVQHAYQDWRAQTDQILQSLPVNMGQRRSTDEDRVKWHALLGAIDEVSQTQIAHQAQSAASARNFVHRGASFGIALSLALGIFLSLFTRRQLKEISLRYRKAIEEALDQAQKAKAAQQAREDFFSIASHELKTPLTTLDLRVHTLQTAIERAALPSTPRSTVNAAMRSLKRQIARLSELIDSILDAAQIHTGQMRLEKSLIPVPVEGLINRSLAATQDILDQSNCKVEAHLEPAVARNWDADRIVQAIKALIHNSAKYAPNSTIVIKSSVIDEHVRLEVIDHGLGIASRDHPRIFRLFERGVSSRHYGGLGTGLYIAREIIEAHRGTIRVMSQEGAGSTVIIDLPLSEEKQTRAA